IICSKYQHAEARIRAEELRNRFDSVDVWHFQIEQHHIRPESRGQSDGFATGARLADHLQIVFVGQYRCQALADDRMIIHHDDANHSAGTRVETSVPFPGALLTCNRPPRSLARSRIPIRPCRSGGRTRETKPTPSSLTDRLTV